MKLLPSLLVVLCAVVVIDKTAGARQRVYWLASECSSLAVLEATTTSTCACLGEMIEETFMVMTRDKRLTFVYKPEFT